MCGIAGHLAFPAADPALVKAMIDALAHRGPDGVGDYHAGPIALGHTRLAVIDLQTGDQPKFNEDRQVAVVFNGEIYNYRELRNGLKSRHRFASESDTEVLVHLYEDFGEDMVGRLEGMFSFAIWDARRKRIFAARDRFGEKPFLYLKDAQGFFFASELASFGAAGVGRGEVDFAALSDYLKFLYIPAPRTIWKDVSKLAPGHALIADRNGVSTFSYWRPPTPGSNPRSKLSVDRLLGELRRSVSLRLRSDVPMGALLSGGIDSSSIVALMAQELGPGVKTFSVGFDRDDDELRFARVVAKKYRTDHHEIMVRNDLATQAIDAFGAFSEPLGDSSTVPTTAVFKEVAKHVKVALTGDGGDELFAGYGRYRLVERIPKAPIKSFPMLRGVGWQHPVARKLRRLLRVMGSTGVARNTALVEVFSQDERELMLGTQAYFGKGFACRDTKGHANAAIGFDLNVYLPDDLLVKVDIASMAAGVESRAPFLDHHLADCVIPEPVHAKQNRREGKLLLKQAMTSLLPPVILGREKRGFGSPVEAWLAGPLRELLQDTLGDRNAIVYDWLDGSEVSRIVRECVKGRGNAHQGWALLALERWAQKYCRVRRITNEPVAVARSVSPSQLVGHPSR